MFETRDSHMLSVIAIVSNGIALILSILSNRFRWSERALKHDELLAMYSLIAQKARRLEDQWMEDRDARLFCNNLQDLFETAKNRGLEPSVRHFKKAKKLIRTLNVYPFGITSKTVNEVDDTLDAT